MNSGIGSMDHVCCCDGGCHSNIAAAAVSGLATHPMPGSMASDMKLICAPWRSSIRLLKKAVRQSSTMPAEPEGVGRQPAADTQSETLSKCRHACSLRCDFKHVCSKYACGCDAVCMVSSSRGTCAAAQCLVQGYVMSLTKLQLLTTPIFGHSPVTSTWTWKHAPAPHRAAAATATAPAAPAADSLDRAPMLRGIACACTPLPNAAPPLTGSSRT
jgi:hypothetical protein